MSLRLVSDEDILKLSKVLFIRTLCFDVNPRGKVPRQLLGVPRPIAR